MGGVGAIHVKRRVGLGVALALGLLQNVGVAAAILGHAGEDVVAGAVEDALQREDLIGGEPLAEGADDRDAAADRRLEGDGLAVLPARVEDLGAVRRQQRLVGGDDVLARGQQIEHRLPGPVNAADDFDRDLDRRVVDHLLEIGGDERPGKIHIARLVEIAQHDAAQLERSAGAGGEPLGMVEQQFGDARADGAAADQGDAELVHADQYRQGARHEKLTQRRRRKERQGVTTTLGVPTVFGTSFHSFHHPAANWDKRDERTRDGLYLAEWIRRAAVNEFFWRNHCRDKEIDGFVARAVAPPTRRNENCVHRCNVLSR